MFVTAVVLNFFVLGWIEVVPFSLTTPISVVIGAIVGYVAVYTLDIRATLAQRFSVVDSRP